MEFSWTALLVICPLVLLAGFIDAIAGGGGLITLPAYLAVGLPAQMAGGTNKFSAFCGTLVSTIRFLKSGKVAIWAALCSVGAALIGSALGARLALWVNPEILRWVLVGALPVIAALVLIRKPGEKADPEVMGIHKKRTLLISTVIGLLIGTYDGFFGPGTGTFLILAYTAICGFDLVTASGNAKCVNLASNFAALVVYLINGKVLLWLAIPAAACGFVGNWLGAGFAIKGGSKVVRPMLLVVLTLLFGKVLWDLIKGAL